VFEKSFADLKRDSLLLDRIKVISNEREKQRSGALPEEKVMELIQLSPKNQITVKGIIGYGVTNSNKL
jgi:hypothetical protein